MGSHNKSLMELTTQQNGWLRMADMKNSLFDELQRAELQVQSSLEEVTTENLKSAKSIMTGAKEKRMAFTGMITDKLINPAMEYEKRMQNVINAAAVVELEMRKKQEEETLKAQAIINEESALRAHITNEYFQIAAENRLNYEKAIDASYRNCLRDRIAVDKIPAMVADMKHILSLFELPEMAKFQRTHVSDERAMEIYQSIEKYDPKLDLMRYQSEAEKKWINYEMDLANAEAAIKALEKQAAEREAEIAQEIAIETATNTLIAQAETITLETPRIKREVKIIVVESEAWAKAVIVNFIRIFPIEKLRVKSWSKLTLAQMAEALAKSGAELHNLQMEEVCK
jgi:hypothetical protein